MTTKNKLLAIGLIGLATGPVGLAMAATVITSLYFASLVPCDNSTDCHMKGDTSGLMYQAGPANLFNGTKVIPFANGVATSVRLGQMQALYNDRGGNWPSSVTFFSNGNVKIYPRTGNDTGWCVLGDQADCGGSAANCPVTLTAPTLRG